MIINFNIKRAPKNLMNLIYLRIYLTLPIVKNKNILTFRNIILELILK
jgi:hypothetical protein